MFVDWGRVNWLTVRVKIGDLFLWNASCWWLQLVWKSNPNHVEIRLDSLSVRIAIINILIAAGLGFGWSTPWHKHLGTKKPNIHLCLVVATIFTLSFDKSTWIGFTRNFQVFKYPTTQSNWKISSYGTRSMRFHQRCDRGNLQFGLIDFHCFYKRWL